MSILREHKLRPIRKTESAESTLSLPITFLEFCKVQVLSGNSTKIKIKFDSPFLKNVSKRICPEIASCSRRRCAGFKRSFLHPRAPESSKLYGASSYVLFVLTRKTTVALCRVGRSVRSTPLFARRTPGTIDREPALAVQGCGAYCGSPCVCCHKPACIHAPRQLRTESLEKPTRFLFMHSSAQASKRLERILGKI